MTDDERAVASRVAFMRRVTNVITIILAVIAVGGFVVLLQYVASVGLPHVR